MGKVSRQPRTKKTHSSDSRDPIWLLGYTDCQSGCQAGFEHCEIAMRPSGLGGTLKQQRTTNAPREE